MFSGEKAAIVICDNIENAEKKKFRVYANVTVEVGYDIYAASAKEAMEMVKEPGLYPDHMNDEPLNVVKVLGAVDFDDVSGVTYMENLEEINRLKQEAALRAREDREYAKQERFDNAEDD